MYNNNLYEAIQIMFIFNNNESKKHSTLNIVLITLFITCEPIPLNFILIVAIYLELFFKDIFDRLYYNRCSLSVLRSATRRIGVFEVKSRSRLANHVYYSIATATLAQCTNTCLADSNCVSINYEHRSASFEKTCEINRDSHTNNPADLEQMDSFQYVFFKGEWSTMNSVMSQFEASLEEISRRSGYDQPISKHDVWLKAFLYETMRHILLQGQHSKEPNWVF